MSKEENKDINKVLKIAKKGNLIFAFNEGEKTASLIGNDSAAGDVLIPHSINYQKQNFIVTSIKKHSFLYSFMVKSIQFLSNSELATIDKKAFNLCFLESISIPSSVTRIGKRAFYGCFKLKHVEIPNDSKLHIIEEEAFMSTNIESIKIPPNITRICRGTFLSCLELAEIIIPIDSKIQIIEENAFKGTIIENIFIPSTVIELKEGWCYSTEKLVKVTISSENKRYKNYGDNLVIGKSDIKSNVFDDLVFASRNIETIEIPSFIKRIASYAFSKSSITHIDISSGIIEISEGAFSFCEMLQKVNFHSDSQLHIIGTKAFSYSSIKEFIIPSHVTKICRSTFSNCHNLLSVETSQDSELKTIELEAFDLSPIESLSIPSSLSEFQNGWCINTPKLTNVNVIPTKQHNISCYENKCIIGKSDIKSDIFDILLFVPRNAHSFSIPSFIKKIGSYAFSTSSISSISIPPQVTHICDGAFYKCMLLESVEMPLDSELQEIGDYSFNQSFIKYFNIPSHVKRIGKEAFNDCSNCKCIETGANSELVTIGKNAFSFSSIESLSIPSSVSEIKNGWIAGTKKLNKITIIPSNQHNISCYKGKFIIGKSDLKSDEFNVLLFVPRKTKFFSIPSFIKKIGSYAFSTSLIENICIPPHVTHIYNGAFHLCKNLNYIDIHPDSKLKEIGKYAFFSVSIKSIFIPPGIEKINKLAFFYTPTIELFEIDENTSLKLVKRENIKDSQHSFIMIPNKLKYYIQ